MSEALEHYLTKKEADALYAAIGTSGPAVDPSAVHFTVQGLTGGQQAQARTNIAALQVGYTDPGVVRWDVATSLTSGQMAQARANIGAGTGGGGGSGDMLAANNLSDLANEAAARGHLHLPTFFTFEEHGAVGNGTTDDSIALNATVVAAAAAQCGVIVADPNKIYGVGGALGGPITWLSGVRLIAGHDIGNTGSSHHGAQFAVLASFPTDTYVIDSPTSAITGAAIIGLSIAAITPSGTGSQRVGGIRFQNSAYGTISGCVVGGMSLPCINVVNGVANQVSRNGCQFFTNFRTLTQNEGAVIVGGTDNWIERNQCNAGGFTAVQYPATFFRCGLLINCLTSWIMGNNGEYADVGVKIVGDSNMIVSLRGDVNAGRGIMFEGALGNTCHGMLLYNDSLASVGAYDGIYFDANSYGNSIFGIAASALPGQKYRTIVNDQANTGVNPDSYPYIPNAVRDIKAPWSMIAFDLYQVATPFTAVFASGSGFPYFRPSSRWMTGGTWWDSANNRPTFSDGVNWRDLAGKIAGNCLLSPAAWFQGTPPTSSQWTVFNSTFLTITDGITAFGRPNALPMTPTGAGVTGNIMGAQSAVAIPCVPGDQFVPVFYSRVKTGAAATAQCSVTWLNASLVVISTTANSTAACPTGAVGGKCLGAAVTAPALAAFAVMNVSFTRVGGLISTDVIEMSKLGMITGAWATDYVPA